MVKDVLMVVKRARLKLGRSSQGDNQSASLSGRQLRQVQEKRLENMETPDESRDGPRGEAG